MKKRKKKSVACEAGGEEVEDQRKSPRGPATEKNRISRSAARSTAWFVPGSRGGEWVPIGTV